MSAASTELDLLIGTRWKKPAFIKKAPIRETLINSKCAPK